MKINKLALCTLLSLPFFSLVAAPPTQSETLKYSLTGHSFAHAIDSTQVESRVVGLYLRLNSNYQLNPTIDFKLTAGALLETGTDRSLWVSEFSPDQQVVLEEASFNWTPFQFFELNLGALDQGSYDLPTLLESNAFAGVRETFKLGLGEGRILELSSQQALPSNQTLSNRLGNVESGTPKFFLHRLALGLGGDLLALKLYAGLFEYRDLSEGVAQQSRFLGNTVTGISASNARFTYSYKGQFYGGELAWYVNDQLSFKVKGHIIENSDAPDLRSKARYAEGGFTYQALTLVLASFRLESDASVAFYNSKAFGHNNREGHLAKLGHNSKLARFELTYARSDIISAGPYQGEQTYIALGLSKDLI